MNVQDWGGMFGSYKKWATGYDKYKRAMQNRVKDIYRTPEGLNVLKHWINDHNEGATIGGVACFITRVSTDWVNNHIRLQPPSAEVGKMAVTHWALPLPTNAAHAMTFVGYNDNVIVPLNDDGQFTNNIDITGDGIVDMRDWEIGAFKIANSWGKNWPFPIDGGFYYMPYRLMVESPSVIFSEAYVCTAEDAPAPTTTIKVKASHISRDHVNFIVGVAGNPSAIYPETTKSFYTYNPDLCGGGALPLQGDNSNPIEIELDLSSFDTESIGKYFFKVESSDSQNPANNNIEGQILDVSLNIYNSDISLKIPYTERVLPVSIQTNLPSNSTDGIFGFRFTKLPNFIDSDYRLYSDAYIIGETIIKPTANIYTTTNSNLTLNLVGASLVIESTSSLDFTNSVLMKGYEATTNNIIVHGKLNISDLKSLTLSNTNLTIKSGGTLKLGNNCNLEIGNRCNFILEPGATVEMGENAAINANTQANIYAVGTLNQPITIRNPRTGTLWNGISSGFSGGLNGDMNLKYCNIIGMLNGISGVPSVATIYNCNFSSVGVAINLANCNKANITDNNFYGRDAFNTAITLTQSIGSIERNQITGFGTGIKVVSSSPNIVSNDIFGNAICGLTSDGINGRPVVTRNNIYNNGNTATGLKAQIEIYETSNIYLANGNNNIYGALNSSGTPFVPCIQKNSTAAMRALNATGNYWGSSSVSNSFFKPVNGSWINYSPYSATAYNNKSGGEATPENLLLTAGLAAQKAGDLTTAENSFSNLITKFADTPESYQAAAALLENYLLGNKDLNKLLTQYTALGASSSWTDSRFFAEMTFKTLLSQQNNTAAFAKATELFNSAANDREKILARIDQFLSASSDNKAQNLGNTNLNALLIMLDNGKFTDLAGETLNNNLPANYRLYNSYPNPFNPSTTIKFDLPVNSLVKLAVYDVAGRQVAVLANGLLNGGTHSMEFNGAKLASGVYFYQLEAEGKIIGRSKMMLLK